MSVVLSIIAFFLIFSLLVLIHEGGHFFMAKRAKVKVEEFGFGLPPRIFGKKYGETIYSINAIPFGGFVKLYGEDSTDKKISQNKRSFVAKSARARILIVCGGVIMNFLLAFFLLAFGFFIGIKPLFVDEKDVLQAIADNQIEIQQGEIQDKSLIYLPHFQVKNLNDDNIYGLVNGDVIWKVDGQNIWEISDFYNTLAKGLPQTMLVKRMVDGEEQEVILNFPLLGYVGISEVLADSAAESFGFEAGQKILMIDGHNMASPYDLINYNNANAGKQAKYTIEDLDGARKIVEVDIPGNGKLGLVLEPVFRMGIFNFDLVEGLIPYSILNIQEVKLPWYLSLKEAFVEIKRLSKATFIGISSVFYTIFSTGNVPEGVSGPVGIAQMVHLTIKEGFNSLIRLTAVLSLSLAVLNILPIPALDGGRLLFILIEVVMGKKSNAKIEAFAHQIGYILLLLLILLITYKDVMRLIFVKAS